MFEISQLNEKKLSDLQEIAQKLNVPKFRSLKKADLVYQILDHQATNPKAVETVVEPTPQPEAAPEKKEVKNPRQRVIKPVKNVPSKPVEQKVLFEKEEVPAEKAPQETIENKKPVEAPKPREPRVPNERVNDNQQKQVNPKREHNQNQPPKKSKSKST